MIDNKLLNAYVNELEALRLHGQEFAQAYPDIAARLDIGPRRSRDPHVERLVESAAFLAARLRLHVEGQSAELPTALLSMLAPTLLDPVPAMTILHLRGGSEAQSIPRGTRFDHRFGGHALVCLCTTARVIAAPFSVQVRRLGPQDNHADGLSIKLVGAPPPTLQFYLGNNALSAATLMDALAEDLAAIEVIDPDGTNSTTLSASRLRMRGFAPDEAVLPVRNAVHQAHRIVTEFIAFPEKFRFVSLTGAQFRNGTEIRLFFSQPMTFARELPQDLISVNHVPAVNLWPTSATPFDITGRQLDYPVRVDAQRYRIVECHSVEEVQMYGPGGGQPVRLDPMLATGDILDTDVRWGTRRTVTPAGGEVMLYFQGLDYRTLGQQTYLAAPRVLASNGDLPRRGRVGQPVHPVEGLGDWRATLATVPTSYRPALIQSQAMRTLLAYMQSSVSNLATTDRRGQLRHYLRQFPGAENASWIDAIGRVAVRSFATMRGGFAQPAIRAFVAFDAASTRSTSRAVLRRVLAELFDSQRSLNRVQEVHVVTT